MWQGVFDLDSERSELIFVDPHKGSRESGVI